MDNKDKIIEEIAKDIHRVCTACSGEMFDEYTCDRCQAKLLIEKGYRKIDKDSVLLSREEYEKLRSLYDYGPGSYMTSSIGNLPLTVEGLRKAVDEITRLNRVEAELQELNIKYYNEAKDLRRELKQARKETADKIIREIIDKLIARKAIVKSFYSISESVGVDMAIDEVKKLAKQFGFEIKEYGYEKD